MLCIMYQEPSKVFSSVSLHNSSFCHNNSQKFLLQAIIILDEKEVTEQCGQFGLRKRPYFYHISEKYLLSYDFHCLNSLVTYQPIIIGTNLRALKKCFKVLLLHQDQTTTRSAGSRSWFVVGMIFYLWCREAVVCKHLKISDFISTIMCIVQCQCALHQYYRESNIITNHW